MNLLQSLFTLAQANTEAGAAIAGGIGLLLTCVFGIVGLLLFIFWVWMLIDAIRNPGLSDTERIIWVLVIVFAAPPLGAIIYFFVGRSKTASAAHTTPTEPR
jgi:hypothetical protein